MKDIGLDLNSKKIYHLGIRISVFEEEISSHSLRVWVVPLLAESLQVSASREPHLDMSHEIFKLADW